jgi:sugar lactone lactonase YvrE
MTFNKATNSVLYADATAGTLMQVSAGGAMVTMAQVNQAGGASANANAIGGIATDNLGNIYFTDMQTHTISKITTTNANAGTATIIAGTGAAGYSGDGASALSATFSSPAGIAIDNNNDIYIADSGNNVIRKIDSITGIVTTVAGTGVAGYSGDGGNALQATLNTPYGMASNGSGDIIFTEMGNHTVRELAFGTINTIAGTGQAGFYGDGGLKSFAQFNTPMAVAVDSKGNIFVADTGNNRVRMISNSFIETIAGNGSNTSMQAGSSMDSTSAGIALPTGVGVDSQDNLYVADSLSKNIVLVDTTGAGNTTNPNSQTSCTTGNATQTGIMLMMFVLLLMTTLWKKSGLEMRYANDE